MSCVSFNKAQGTRNKTLAVGPHYHTERNHQGIGNRLINPAPNVGSLTGPIRIKRRLGGILSYYYREAA